LANIVCNTASVSALKILRKKVRIPVVGTVPAIKPASLITKKNRIGIIATPNTVKLNYLPDLINQYAKDKEVFIKGSQNLANIVEENYSQEEIHSIIDEELSFFKDKDIDVLVLGCTHYFFLKKEISDYFENKVIILDSIEGVTNRIIDIMKNVEYSNNRDRILILSKASDITKEKYQRICNKEKNLFNKILIEDLSCQKV
jgi:glutamate racemase